LIHDISLIHQAGLKVIVAPGARKQINKILDDDKIEWKMQNGLRVAPDSIDSIPAERKALWSPERGSKVYRIKL